MPASIQNRACSSIDYAFLWSLVLWLSEFKWRRCEILRGGMDQYLTPMGPTKLHVNPIFEIGPLEPRFSEWLVFEGLSVDETGKQHYLDATVAFKRAVLNCIDYLSKFGYTKEQVRTCMHVMSFVCIGATMGCFDSGMLSVHPVLQVAFFQLVCVL